MNRFGLQIESFLQSRSRREMILLFASCFLMGFSFAVGLFYGNIKNEIMEIKEKNRNFNHMLLALQDDIAMQGNLNIQDTEAIYKEIEVMEQKIALQEEQKRFVLERFGVYSLRELSDINFLYNLEIEQERGRINLRAKGKYDAIFSFLESLQVQSRLSYFAMQIYPNPNSMDLEFYITFQNQGD